MTIQQLEYIVAVYREGSFTKAAETCFVTQPTLSMQIQKLEEELGVILFDRSKKPLRATAIGEEIIAQAQSNIRGMERIRELIDSKNQTLSGDLRIGIIPTLTPYLLPLFLGSFIKNYPNVNLTIEEQISEKIISNLRQEKLDVGLMASIKTQQPIKEIPLFYESFVAYISAGHPLSEQKFLRVKDLNINEMLVLEEGHCFRDQMLRICSEQRDSSQKSALIFESGSLETLKNLIEKDFGYTLLPALAIQNLSAKQKKLVRELGHPRPVRQISLIMHRDVLKQRMITALREEILRSIPESLKKAEQDSVVY